MSSIEPKLASIYRRGIAFVVDEIVVCLIRSVILSILIMLFFYDEIKNFLTDFKSFILSLPDSANLLEILRIILAMKITTWMIILTILFVIIYPIYQYIMYKYYNGATIGKKFANIVVLRDNCSKLRNSDIITRIILGYMPWLLPFVIYYLFTINSGFYVILLIIWFFWYDPWILTFNRKNKTIHDMISGTSVFILEDKKDNDIK